MRLAAQDPPADFVAQYCVPFSKQVMAALLGVDDAVLEQLTRHYDALIAIDPALEASIQAGWEAFRDLVLVVLEEKRGSVHDDLLTRLLANFEQQSEVDESHLIGLVVTLLAAGIGTPIVQLGNGMANLLRHQDELAKLAADPTLASGAVEEILRYNAPVEVEHLRITTEPVTLADAVVPAGSPVLTSIASANRDAGKFCDPDRFQIDRSLEPHLAFGFGPHVCAGSVLARAQLTSALRAVLRHLPDVHLAVDHAALRSKRKGLHSVGIRELPISWTWESDR